MVCSESQAAQIEITADREAFLKKQEGSITQAFWPTVVFLAGLADLQKLDESQVMIYALALSLLSVDGGNLES